MREEKKPEYAQGATNLTFFKHIDMSIDSSDYYSTVFINYCLIQSGLNEFYS